MKYKGLFIMSMALMLAGCGGTPATSSSSSIDTTPRDERGFELYEYTDVIDGQTTSFSKFPDKYKKKADKQGRVIAVPYSTSVYEDGNTYEKKVNVYLPYGYDESNTSKKYNVIYMQHGNKRTENDLMRPDEVTEYQNMMDNVFDPDKGGIEPAIMVFPTYYVDDVHTNAGDVMQTILPANYSKEVYQDIIPTVESQFNTYLAGTSEDDVKASRDHRLFAGYSRGGCCTWYMTIEALPYFKWFQPMSAGSMATFADDKLVIYDNEELYAAHKAAIDAYDGDFFIYSAGGHEEAKSVGEWVNFLSKKTETYHYGTNIAGGDNLCYFASPFPHLDEYSAYYFYNTLQTIFH